MERESAVREILQSIGPMFPEDAEKARAARREAFAKAGQPAEPDAPTMTAAPKPMLASQIDNAEKTEVASLASVLERLTPPAPPQSVRDAVPELVRPIVPDVSALRAALNLRDPEPVVEPVVETAPAFTELPADPSETMAVEETPKVTPEPELPLVIADDVVFEAPSATEIQAALAEAIEAQRDPAERVTEGPVVLPPADFSEDEHDAFVSAIADAILPVRPYPPAADAGDETVAVATVAQPEPVAEVAAAPIEEPVVAQSPAVETVAPAPAAEQPKPKFKRAKPKKPAEAKPEIVQVQVPPAKVSEPDAHPEPAPLTADDELVRQLRVHRDDMIDVDDQIARIDQEIAAEQQAMAQYVAMVEQKNDRRARLVRLRTTTQRFVETLQLKAEPVKRASKTVAKSA